MTSQPGWGWLLIVILVAVGLWSAWTSPGIAQSTEGPSANAGATAAPKIDAGDNAWVLTSSALVLMMTAPGLALFYCGLVRKKNVLSVMMQCVFLMCLMTVIWALYGYTLVFGGDGAVDRRLSLPCSCRAWTPCGQRHGSDIPAVSGLTIPVLTHMLFQGMFFIITPALICGAFAERMKFSAMVLFMVLWGTLIYCPLAHWVWGGGMLAYGSPHAASSRPAGPWISPAERWCTSAPACRPWFVPCCWASGWATAGNRCRRIT